MLRIDEIVLTPDEEPAYSVILPYISLHCNSKSNNLAIPVRYSTKPLKFWAWLLIGPATDFAGSNRSSSTKAGAASGPLGKQAKCFQPRYSDESGRVDAAVCRWLDPAEKEGIEMVEGLSLFHAAEWKYNGYFEASPTLGVLTETFKTTRGDRWMPRHVWAEVRMGSWFPRRLRFMLLAQPARLSFRSKMMLLQSSGWFRTPAWELSPAWSHILLPLLARSGHLARHRVTKPFRSFIEPGRNTAT